MKLSEVLDDTKLAYHDELNPKLWETKSGEVELKPEVRTKMIKIAEQFVETLGLQDKQIKDYVFTGSNANYNWTSLSDVDIHVIVDMSDCEDCKRKTVGVKDCIDAKKTLWNDRHNIKIYGFPVELYASDVKDPIASDAGVYSLLKNTWMKVPEKKNIEIDSATIRSKADSLAHEIDDLIASKTDDKSVIQELTNRIANYRKAGIQKGGEFSVENLVFKALRNNGYIQKIRKYAVDAQDHTLSLDESLLQELFNSDVPFAVAADTDDLLTTKATINGRKIVFNARNEDIEGASLTYWYAEFFELGDQNDKKYNTTKGGKEFEVFSMIKKSMEILINKREPDIIFFSAAKEDRSRADVYEKLLKRYAKGYTLVRNDRGGRAVKFKLVRD